MKQTRSELQRTYIDLCARMPADKITVKELVSTCGINRNSFYYHFEDLPSLAVSIMEDEIRENFTDSAHPEEDFTDRFLRCAGALQNNLDFYRNVYYSKNREVLDYRFKRLMNEMISDYMKENIFPGHDLSEEDQKLIIQLYCMETTGLFIAWLQEGMKYDLVSRLKRLFELRKGTVEMMVERADRTPYAGSWNHSDRQN